MGQIQKEYFEKNYDVYKMKEEPIEIIAEDKEEKNIPEEEKKEKT
jgi:hypothetical protein